MKIATKLIHGGPTVDPQTGALGVPIYQISTYQQTSVDHFRKYDYARGDNPTREALEDTIAVLEGGTPLPGLLLRHGGHLHDPDDLLPRRPSGGLRRCLRRRLPGALHDLQPHGDQLHLRGRDRSGCHRSGHQAGNQGNLSGDPLQPAAEDHRPARRGRRSPGDTASSPWWTTPS